MLDWLSKIYNFHCDKSRFSKSDVQELTEL